MWLNCCKNFFSQGLILIYILILIFIYEICKHIQTCRNKAILSRGIANQRVKVIGTWEEEKHGWITYWRVGLPPPHLDFYVTQYLKSSINIGTSLMVYSMFSDIVHPSFLNFNLQWLVTRNTQREFVLGTCSCYPSLFFYILFSCS